MVNRIALMFFAAILSLISCSKNPASSSNSGFATPAQVAQKYLEYLGTSDSTSALNTCLISEAEFLRIFKDTAYETSGTYIDTLVMDFDEAMQDFKWGFRNDVAQIQGSPIPPSLPFRPVPASHKEHLRHQIFQN